MVTRATALNPQVLRWARNQSGLSLDEAASRIRKSAADLEAWESGNGFPTYLQLERLAENVYKRPVALFFLPEPPDESPPASDFRTLPEAFRNALAPDTRLAVREAHAFQLSLSELSDGKNPADRQIWKELRGSPDRVQALAQRTRDYLGVSLQTQRGWRATRQAMREWRNAVEEVGIFVFKRSFKQREISGFCLDDDEFPIIVINNSTALSRQIFTLFHELGHILFDVSSVTTVDPTFAEQLTGEARQIEVACNRFAAECLIPELAFPWERFQTPPFDESISATADEFNVSREVVLRRLWDENRISSQYYEAKVVEWHEEFQNRERGTGGDYYNAQAAYLGEAFLNLAFSQFYAGRVSLPELAQHLGMKAKNVSRLEERVLARK